MNNQWVMPEWMEQYAGKYIPSKETCESYMNDTRTNIEINAPLTLMIVDTTAKIRILEQLHRDNLFNKEEKHTSVDETMKQYKLNFTFIESR